MRARTLILSFLLLSATLLAAASAGTAAARACQRLVPRREGGREALRRERHGGWRATLARMGLERATSGCTLEETEARVNTTLTVTDDVEHLGEAASARVAASPRVSPRSGHFNVHIKTLKWRIPVG